MVIGRVGPDGNLEVGYGECRGGQVMLGHWTWVMG